MALQSTSSGLDEFCNSHGVPSELLAHHLGRLLQPREDVEVLCFRVPFGDEFQEATMVTNVHKLLNCLAAPNLQCRLHHPPSRLLDRIKTGCRLRSKLLVADVRGWDTRNINSLLKYVGTKRVGDMHVVLLAPPYPLTGVREGHVRLIPINLTDNTGDMPTGVTPQDIVSFAALHECHGMARICHCNAGEHAAYITHQRQLMGLTA